MVSAGAMLLDRLGPPGFRFNDSGPRDWLFYQLYTRARALLARPWSARCYGVARPREGSRPNSIGGLGRAFTPAFRAGSLYPLARGCRRSRRGEIWLRPVRCCSTGSGRLDLDLMIPGPAIGSSISYTRARGRCWPGRGLPVATGELAHERGRAQTASGGSGVLSLRHFGLVLFIPWRVGAEEAGAAKYGFGRCDAARPARAAWI